LKNAAAHLRKKADDYRSIAEEHCAPADQAMILYLTIELALRGLARRSRKTNLKPAYLRLQTQPMVRPQLTRIPY
jgi:hypothetical protein